MLAIYMPLIRDAVHAYVELWNHHNIRKQPNRPNAVTGQPYILYHYPLDGVQSYEVPVNQNWISQLQQGMEEWGMHFLLIYCASGLWLNSGVDIDEYLPQETNEWCIQQLNMHGINITNLQSSDVAVDGSRAHTQAYVCLRHIVQEYIISGIAPLLLESLKPTSGYESVQMQGGAVWDLVQDNAEFVRLQDNQDYI
jgi:hypothetical protein